MTLSRRRLLLAPALLSLAGCGFHPVYMPTASGKAGPAARELAAVDVALIPERSGQLLRQALQERFADDSRGTPLQYDLRASMSIAEDSIDIRPDTVATRMRITGTSNYALWTKAFPPTHLISGRVHAVDSFNILNQQYFAMDMSIEALTRRLADALADQITTQIATYFRQHAVG
jgi:LPS-assembly lipoprotein